MRFVINDTIPKQFNTKGDILLIADYTNCISGNVRFIKTEKGWYDVLTKRTGEEHP